MNTKIFNSAALTSATHEWPLDVKKWNHGNRLYLIVTRTNYKHLLKILVIVFTFDRCQENTYIAYNLFVLFTNACVYI